MTFESPDWGTVRVEETNYRDGNPALVLHAVDPEIGEEEELCVLTVNLPVAPPLLPGEYYIKTWTENEGLARDALASGLFEDTGKRVPTGYVEAQVWRKKEQPS